MLPSNIKVDPQLTLKLQIEICKKIFIKDNSVCKTLTLSLYDLSVIRPPYVNSYYYERVSNILSTSCVSLWLRGHLLRYKLNNLLDTRLSPNWTPFMNNEDDVLYYSMCILRACFGMQVSCFPQPCTNL